MDAVVVLGVVGLACYLFLRVLMSASTRGSRTDTAGPVQWRTNHYDAKGATRVVVQKVSAGGTNILDEHVVTTVPLDDPEYDAKFLAAMAAARERRAMFEAEDDS